VFDYSWVAIQLFFTTGASIILSFAKSSLLALFLLLKFVAFAFATAAALLLPSVVRLGWRALAAADELRERRDVPCRAGVHELLERPRGEGVGEMRPVGVVVHDANVRHTQRHACLCEVAVGLRQVQEHFGAHAVHVLLCQQLPCAVPAHGLGPPLERGLVELLLIGDGAAHQGHI